MLDTSTCCIQYSSTKVNILSDFKSSFNSSSRIANCPPNRPQNLISDQSQFFFRDALYLVDHDLGGRGNHQGQKARVSVQIRKAALIKEILFRWPIGRHLSTFQVSFQWFLSFREAPLKQRSPLIGMLFDFISPQSERSELGDFLFLQELSMSGWAIGYCDVWARGYCDHISSLYLVWEMTSQFWVQWWHF